MWSKAAAALVAELHHGADVLLRDDHRGLDVRLLDRLDLVRHVGGVVHLDPLAARARLDAVGDGRGGDDQVEVELALQPLAHDLHVQQAEEAAAEAEAERLRGLGLVEERAVVQLQPLERVAELRVLVRVGREEPGEDHRLDFLVAGQRLGRGPLLGRERVADAELGDVLQARDHVAHLAGLERLDRVAVGRQEAELLRLEAGSLRHRAERVARLEAAVDDADERDDAAVLVVGGVEDQRAGGRVGIPSGGGIRSTIASSTSSTPSAGLRRDAEDVVGVVADQVGDLGGGAVGIGLRQVDLVHERDDLEVVLDRQVRVRERLRLDPLRRVDDEQRALAGLQRARDLVGEVHVTGRIDQVQLVALPEHAHGLRLDRDPALALELHRVEQLLLHVAVGDRVRELQDAIGQRRLPMVDVGDDREVADVCLVHACQAPAEAVSQGE